MWKLNSNILYMQRRAKAVCILSESTMPVDAKKCVFCTGHPLIVGTYPSYLGVLQPKRLSNLP